MSSATPAAVLLVLLTNLRQKDLRQFGDDCISVFRILRCKLAHAEVGIDVKKDFRLPRFENGLGRDPVASRSLKEAGLATFGIGAAAHSCPQDHKREVEAGDSFAACRNCLRFDGLGDLPECLRAVVPLLAREGAV